MDSAVLKNVFGNGGRYDFEVLSRPLRMNLLLTSRRAGLAGAVALLGCSNTHPGTSTAAGTSGTGGAAAEA